MGEIRYEDYIVLPLEGFGWQDSADSIDYTDIDSIYNISIAIAYITVLICIQFGNKGNISNVKRVIGYSSLYDENVENRFSDEMMEYNTMHKKELIIVLSNFETGRKSRDLGFTPNETYEKWKWRLVRTDQQQEWEVVEDSWGY